MHSLLLIEVGFSSGLLTSDLGMLPLIGVLIKTPLVASDGKNTK